MCLYTIKSYTQLKKLSTGKSIKERNIGQEQNAGRTFFTLSLSFFGNENSMNVKTYIYDIFNFSYKIITRAHLS